MKSSKSVLITDLDNTLFDWFALWDGSFRPLLDALVEKSGIPRDTLIAEIKTIHEKHGTAEYAYLLSELPSLKATHNGADVADVYQSALNTYRATREKNLKLYPGVLATLKTLKENGVLLVGYTESMEVYTTERIKRLGLDGVLDIVFLPENHATPAELTADQRKKYVPEESKLTETRIEHTPKGEVKPNPDVLKDIIAKLGADAGDCVYVGDNLNKDVQMAQKAGVMDVHAKEGVAHQKEEYDLLRAVTHWTAAQVEAEKKSVCEVTPTYVLECGYSELLTLFKFTRYTGKLAPPPPEDRIPQLIDVWKKTVDVQQHFNDMEMRIRSYAITVVGAILGGVVLVVKEAIFLPILGFQISASVPLVLLAILVGAAFWFMDRHWYHRLLIGSVKQGGLIEERLASVLPEAGLGKAISKESPFAWLGYRFHSSDKLNLYYGFWALALIVVMIVLAIFVRPKEPAPSPPPIPPAVSLAPDLGVSGTGGSRS
jgi:FMN phosphatase YigB (HAD superfamily)